jgi:hypothetical protein
MTHGMDLGAAPHPESARKTGYFFGGGREAM